MSRIYCADCGGVLDRNETLYTCGACKVFFFTREGESVVKGVADKAGITVEELMERLEKQAHRKLDAV